MYWGFLCSAALSLSTVVLLFQPWLRAQGPNGRVVSDAFGRTQGITDSTSDQWGEGAYPAHISGGWGILTAALAILTIFAVGLYLRDGSATLALIVLGSAAGQALSVFCTLLYLNGKGPAFKTLVENSGTGGLRDLFGGSSNVREVASVGLGMAALLGGITALGALLLALTSVMPLRGTDRAAATDRPSTPAPDTAPQPTPGLPHYPESPSTPRTVARQATPHPTPQPHSEARPQHPAPTDLERLTIRLPFAPTTAATHRPEHALFAGSAAER
ncbi:hypothetical protein [Nocardia blacklockiae]|uniref:hypothetical protein n=1 Tax=Nocardia blacklockiae TaxID=480036 RepID=UPI0018949F51|nr:hypothetical protein [Nocardia blacklockiae]MBF6174634.1 hypothetical protein [Nocardia blacklockiae]